MKIYQEIVNRYCNIICVTLYFLLKTLNSLHYKYDENDIYF